MRCQMPWPAINVCEVGLLHAGGGIPCRPHEAASGDTLVCYNGYVPSSDESESESRRSEPVLIPQYSERRG